jgi:NitT/TauT family transport system substrate-binding protein
MRILMPLLAALLSMAGAHAEPVAVDKRIVLVVDEWKAVRNLPVVVAERLGYFRSAGMDVTVMNVRDDVWHGDLLMDGRADAVMAYWHHNVVNQSKGRDTEAIVTLGTTPGVKVLVAKQARGRFRTPADLQGARIIAGGAGSSKTTVANALVLAGGHALTEYTRLGTSGKEANAVALREGRADLVVAPVPEADSYVAQGVASVFADLTTLEGTRAAFGVPFPTATVFMARERVQQHPEMAAHLATAFLRALQFMHAHSAEEIAAIVPKEVRGKDDAKYLAALREALPMFAGDGRMPPQGAAFELEALRKFDPKYAPVAAERTYTNAIVDAAQARLQATSTAGDSR